MGKLPELIAPAEYFYNKDNSHKYESNSRIREIQRELSRKCFDFLELTEPGLILDIGCGTGISGSVLSDNNCNWIGLDISTDMLKICQEKNECLNLFKCDAGEGLPFRPGIFDGVISVSAIQWLFQSYKSEHIPKKRIRLFFTSLFSVIKPNTKCVLQFYLKNKKDIDLLKNEAARAGFDGGIHVEGSNTKNEKSFLILQNYVAKKCAAKKQPKLKKRKIKNK